MRVDHGGADIFMPQEFLHSADVVAILQQMRRKGMAARFDIMLHLIDHD
jgi:hypothetical protein